MDILGVIWLEHIAEKLAVKHRVETYEVEEVLARAARFRRIERGDVVGEDLYATVGATAGGRALIVFFIYKGSKEALVVSAREATPRERQQYGRK